MIARFWFCLTVFLSVFTVANAEGNFFIIVNKQNQTTEISKQVLKEIYLGERTHWESGLRIIPIRPEDNPNMKYVEGITGKSVRDFKTHWRRKLFSGRGLPPRKIKKETEILEFVASHPGAIGIISKETKSDSVKSIGMTHQ